MAVLVLGLVVGAARYGHLPRRLAPVTAPQFQGQNVYAPAGAHVRVEVLNATHTRGLGRRATFYLRDHGFDVVSWGTGPVMHDTTVVIDRSGHPEWAHLVARALGVARVESRPDSSRDVDTSVLVGSTWRPPPQPFHP